MSELEYFRMLKQQGDEDVSNGDYVTTLRVDHGFMIYERILTFSDITLERRRPKYACYAPTEESAEDY